MRPRAQLGDAQHDVADGGGEPALAVSVARGGPVLAGHVRLRVHDLVHHGLQERARQLPRVEEPVAWVGSCCKVSIAAVPLSTSLTPRFPT